MGCGELNRVSARQRGLNIAIFITGLMMIAEVIGGVLSNSLALLSDAGHMFTDILALTLSLLALRFSAMPATSKKTYGFLRLEILAALINGSILILVSLYIFYNAYKRFLEPPEIKVTFMMAVAFLGLVVNVVAALFLKKDVKGSLNVKGAYLHIIGDILSSVGVLSGGIIILLTGWYRVDPLLSVLIGIVILRGAYGLVKESADIMLEATPKGIDLEEVATHIKKIRGVRDIHHLHIWTITSGIYAMSGHILIEDILTSSSSRILEDVNRLLRERFDIGHTTFQFECESCEDRVVCRIERDI